MSYNLDDLLYLMQRLREPQHGCPWDREQTQKSIINYSIEEIYELADAIEQGDSSAVCDELGDVLFQVIFLAQIASEQSSFDFARVVEGICSKLLRRHPHVFPDGQLYKTNARQIDKAQVAKNWEKIKQQERRQKQQSGIFDDISVALPAILRAVKLQKRASHFNLDWPDASNALEKLKEEISELEQAVNDISNVRVADVSSATGEADASHQNVLLELGDVLFSCVNVARKLGVNPEQSLRMANTKFVRRVECLAKLAATMQGDSAAGKHCDETADGSALHMLSEQQLDQLWEHVKSEGL